MKIQHRKIAAFLGAGILAGLVKSVRGKWQGAKRIDRYLFAALIGGAIGLLIALILRALK